MSAGVQQWWYEFNGEQKGPVQDDEILKLIHHAILKNESLIWTQGFEQWKPIKITKFAIYSKDTFPPPLQGEAVNNNIVWWLAFCPFIGKVIEGIFIRSVLS